MPRKRDLLQESFGINANYMLFARKHTERSHGCRVRTAGLGFHSGNPLKSS
jgi:hypothetical protein